MIIKLTRDEVINGKLRVKGEIVRVKHSIVPEGSYLVINGQNEEEDTKRKIRDIRERDEEGEKKPKKLPKK